MSEGCKRTHVIAATDGWAEPIRKGETVRIIDVAGRQVTDFVAFCANDYNERLDPTVTMDATEKYALMPGDILYSTIYRPMFTILRDDVGKHDLFNSSCRPEMYEFLYHSPNHKSCFENLNLALSAYNVPAAKQHFPFNIFMHTVVTEDGHIRVELPTSKAGDCIELRAEMDMVLGFSACPCAESVCNGYECTPIAIEIFSE